MNITSVERVTIIDEGVTIARLIWNRFQKPMPGLLGEVYAANPGIADTGPFLAVGSVVLLPVPEQREDERVIERVTLWN
jgi:phage tail protein X